MNVFDVKTIFGEKKKVAKIRLERVHNAVPGKPFEVVVGEEVRPVVVDGEEVVRRTAVVQAKDEKGQKLIAIVGNVMLTCVLPFVKVIRHGLLGLAT